MSDVVAAALIAAGVSVIGNAVTFAVAIVTTGRNVRADADRLRDEHHEADRRARRDAYARLLAAIERLDALTSGYGPEPDETAFEAWLTEFRAAGVQVTLVQSHEVAEARGRVNGLLDELSPEVEARLGAGESMADAFGAPYVAMRARLHEAGRALSGAMHADLAYAPRSR